MSGIPALRPTIPMPKVTGFPEGCIYRFEGYYAFLANPYPCPVTSPEDRLTYPSLEHAFQAAKSENYKERMRIAALPTWQEAKRTGQDLQLREGWDDVRKEIMFALVLDKFKRNPDLLEKLLGTGIAHLAEGNDHGDTYWGMVRMICTKDTWQGWNYLGQILMAVRMVLA